MRQITSQEIRELKGFLRWYREEAVRLRQENTELKIQLAEAKAEAGKGCLERAIEAVAGIIQPICREIRTKEIQEANEEEQEEEP